MKMFSQKKIFLVAILLLHCVMFSYATNKKTSFKTSYRLEIEWANFPNSAIILLDNLGYNYNIVDSIKLDARGVGSIVLNNTLSPGLYTLVKPGSSYKENIFVDVVFNIDSVVKIKFNQTNNVVVLVGEENKVHLENMAIVEQIYNRIEADKVKMSSKDVLAEEKLVVNQRIVEDLKKITQMKLMLEQKYPSYVTTLLVEMLDDSSYNFAVKTAEDSAKVKDYLFNNFVNPQYLQNPMFSKVHMSYSKIQEYLTMIVGRNMDMLKSRTRWILDYIYEHNPNKMVFRDILHFIAYRYGMRPPFQGADALFMFLYQNYLKQDKFTPLLQDEVSKMLIFKGRSIEYTQPGMQAPLLMLVDTSRQVVNVNNDVKGDFTVLCFYDPECSHCKKIVPKVDSILFSTGLAFKKNIRAVAINIERDDNAWMRFIHTNRLYNWVHLHDTKELQNLNAQTGNLDYRISYGIDQTPMIFILDRDKKIIGRMVPFVAIEKMINDYVQ